MDNISNKRGNMNISNVNLTSYIPEQNENPHEATFTSIHMVNGSIHTWRHYIY